VFVLKSCVQVDCVQLLFENERPEMLRCRSTGPLGYGLEIEKFYKYRRIEILLEI